MESDHDATTRLLKGRSFAYPREGQSQPRRTSRFSACLENGKDKNRDVCPRNELRSRDDDNHEEMHRQHSTRALYDRSTVPRAVTVPSTVAQPFPQTPQPQLMQLPPLRLPPPIIYLLSFSHNHVLHHSSLSSLLSDIVPDPSTHLYTIRAGSFAKPPKHLWHDFTGAHPLIQDHVMRDPRAQEAVELAVQDLRRAVEGRMGWHVALTVSCGAGTHRSVAVVEKIRDGLEKEAVRSRDRSGVVVRVVHVHRSRREKDPW